jgi:hypothetical protein
MKSRFDASELNEVLDIDRNDFGVSGGVGAMGFVSDNLGIRADVRYFRNLGGHEADGESDLGIGDFDYWRATAGVVLKF